jgi:hypothetical protein
VLQLPAPAAAVLVLPTCAESLFGGDEEPTSLSPHLIPL